MPRTVPTIALILAAATALGVCGCGRKGRLEPPPEQQPLAKPGRAGDPGYAKPHKSFPLDPLLN
jgi:predicted small lipoprotein YifL